MPEPFAICLEDIDAPATSTRYVRCVALVGPQPGLRLDADGRIGWKQDSCTGCELWVSADSRLILFRPEGAVPVWVERGGRGLDVPIDKPVVLVSEDLVVLGERRLRVHVHGPSAIVSAPQPLPPESLAAAPPQGDSDGRWTATGRAAAVVAIGAAVAGCDEIIVRDQPPGAEAVSAGPPGSGTSSAAGTGSTSISATASASTASATSSATTSSATLPIEVRHSPPKMAAPPEDPPPKGDSDDPLAGD